MGKKKKRSSSPEIQGTRLVILNWDEECEMDMRRGRGFEITEPATSGHDTKNMYGIQSPLFCSDWGDEDPFQERFRCECIGPDKGLKGKVFEGERCPECGAIVKFKDVDLSITGWIILHNYKIIHPIFYNKLSSIIGAKQFQDIIKYDKIVNRDGKIVDKETKSSPFAGIGLIEFRERFEEILDYYKGKKKNKLLEIKEIEENMDKIFTSCIPVYSSVLRPSSFREDSFFYSTVDKVYNSIFLSTRLLNDNEVFERRRKKWTKEKRERMTIATILTNIQLKLMDLYGLVFELIDQKDGHIKGEILGGMINWSSRCRLMQRNSLNCGKLLRA